MGRLSCIGNLPPIERDRWKVRAGHRRQKLLPAMEWTRFRGHLMDQPGDSLPSHFYPLFLQLRVDPRRSVGLSDRNGNGHTQSAQGGPECHAFNECG